MAFFARDGLRFHFRESGAGIPFFYQHGLGADVDQPFGLFKPPQGFRLIAFDCRAHGQTEPVGDPQKMSLAAFADDLLALMDLLRIERAIVGGISMGAAVALNFALRFPQRVLALPLQRPAWLAEPNRRNIEIFGEVAKLIREQGGQAGAETFKCSKLYTEIMQESPDCANSLLLQFGSPRASERVVRLERLPQDAPNFDRADWRKIKCPTLILANRQDPIHPFEFGEILAREIPGAELCELTPKSVSVERYTQDVQCFIEGFLHSKTIGPDRTIGERLRPNNQTSNRARSYN
jgi:pimeloyl-ACP methyl ester carboxylesterase